MNNTQPIESPPKWSSDICMHNANGHELCKCGEFLGATDGEPHCRWCGNSTLDQPKNVEDGISDEQHYACVMEGVTHATNGFYAMCHTAGCYWSTHTDCMTKEEAQRAADEHSAKLPKPAEYAIRSATPEELTAQAENRGKNYKPGQAVPFMPQPEAEERIGDHINCPKHGFKFGFCEECVESPEELPQITWVPVYVERAICDLIPDTGYAREIARIGWAWDDEHPGHENALNRWKNEAIRQRRDLIALQELIEHEKNLFPQPVPEERTAEMEQPSMSAGDAAAFILQGQRDALFEVVKGIANADWRSWGDGLNSPQEFVTWAKSIASKAVSDVEGKAKAESQEVKE